MRKIVSLLLVLSLFYIYLSILPSETKAYATLTSAKDTLTNSRLSVNAKVNSGSSGTAVFTIQAGQSDADTSNIFPRDTGCFTDSLTTPSGCVGSVNYTVATVPTYNGTTVELTGTLGATMTAANAWISTQSAQHAVTFTTASAVNNPIIKVLIPAKSSAATSSDGIPDFGATAVAGTSGFDAGGVGNGDVTCTGAGPSWVATFVNANTTGDNYHRAVCTGTGTLAASTPVTIQIGTTHKIINPAPVTSAHTRGVADVYGITINEYDSGGTNIVDSTTVAVAPVEGVLVSATVQNYLTFSIAGVTGGTTVCGKATISTASTATTVPFGSITSGSFYNQAQLLTVSTNGSGGYAVTAQEDNALSIDGLNVTTLANTNCPANSCTTTAYGSWTTNTASGFGYSLANSSGTDATFTYGAAGTFQARPFDSTTAQIVMLNNAPVSGSAVNVCYQLTASNVQKAGYYQDKITYIATPAF